MKPLFWFITLFAMATAVAISVSLNTGYVLIVVAPWRVEVSLAVFVITVALLCLGVYALSRMVFLTLNLPSRIHAYKLRRTRNRARSALYQSLNAYFEGNYRKSERLAETALETNESPALCAIVAARAAHEQRHFIARDQHLARVDALGHEHRMLYLTTRAELLLDERRSREALESLKEAHQISPKHLRATQLLLKAQVAVGNWKAVLQTLDQLELQHGIETDQAKRIRRNAWQQQLRQSAHDPAELTALWRSIPSESKSDHALVHTAASYFISHGLHAEAQTLIERNLEKEWDSGLLALYGECESPSPRDQIENAERWLKSHPNDAVLLLVLAKLCMRQSLWGKAQSYLDASLFIEPSRDGDAMKAMLAEKIGPARSGPRNRPEVGPEFGAA